MFTIEPAWFTRRRLRFGLRSMLVVLTLFALVCGWLRSEYRTSQERASYRERFFHDPSFCLRACSFIERNRPEPAMISWMRRALGEYSVGDLVYDPSQDPDGSIVRRVQALFPEADIRTYSDLKGRRPSGIREIGPGVRLMI